MAHLPASILPTTPVRRSVTARVKQAARAGALALAAIWLSVTTLGGWDLTWITQFGTPSFDFSLSVAADSSGAYVGGFTFGTLPGQVSAGGGDGFLTKFDASGTRLWTVQFGTPSTDAIYDIGVDGTGVYLFGYTFGALPGQANQGGADVFVRKYTLDGQEVWTSQFGTVAFDAPVIAGGLAVSTSGVFVTGFTTGAFPGESAFGARDLFAARLDPATGALSWLRQFGTPGDDVPAVGFGGIAADDSGVYVIGNLNIGVAFMPELRKYDLGGNLLWTQVVGQGDCLPALTGVAAHVSGVYVSGQDFAEVYEAGSDCVDSPARSNVVGLLVKHDPDGIPVWTRLIESRSILGGLEFVGAKGVAAFDSGVYVGGNLTTSFAGDATQEPQGANGQCGPNEDSFFSRLDGYVRRFDFDGNVIWTHQFGGPDFEVVNRVATDGAGIYASSYVDCGAADGLQFLGGTDVYLARFEVDPVSSSGLVQLIVGDLETLRASGSLAQGHFNALVNDLETALSALSRGQPHVAASALHVFIQNLEVLSSSGAMSPVDAAALKSAADAIIQSL